MRLHPEDLNRGMSVSTIAFLVKLHEFLLIPGRFKLMACLFKKKRARYV